MEFTPIQIKQKSQTGQTNLQNERKSKLNIDSVLRINNFEQILTMFLTTSSTAEVVENAAPLLHKEKDNPEGESEETNNQNLLILNAVPKTETAIFLDVEPNREVSQNHSELEVHKTIGLNTSKFAAQDIHLRLSNPVVQSDPIKFNQQESFAINPTGVIVPGEELLNPTRVQAQEEELLNPSSVQIPEDELLNPSSVVVLESKVPKPEKAAIIEGDAPIPITLKGSEGDVPNLVKVVSSEFEMPKSLKGATIEAAVFPTTDSTIKEAGLQYPIKEASPGNVVQSPGDSATQEQLIRNTLYESSNRDFVTTIQNGTESTQAVEQTTFQNTQKMIVPNGQENSTIIEPIQDQHANLFKNHLNIDSNRAVSIPEQSHDLNLTGTGLEREETSHVADSDSKQLKNQSSNGLQQNRVFEHSVMDLQVESPKTPESSKIGVQSRPNLDLGELVDQNQLMKEPSLGVISNQLNRDPGQVIGEGHSNIQQPKTIKIQSNEAPFQTEKQSIVSVEMEPLDQNKLEQNQAVNQNTYRSNPAKTGTYEQIDLIVDHSMEQTDTNVSLPKTDNQYALNEELEYARRKWTVQQLLSEQPTKTVNPQNENQVRNILNNLKTSNGALEKEIMFNEKNMDVDSDVKKRLILDKNLVIGQPVPQPHYTNQSMQTVRQESPPVIHMANFLPEMESWLSQNMKILSGDHGSMVAKLSLFPEHFGHIEVKITTNGGNVSAEIVTETLIAKESLEGQLPQLKHSLQQSGLYVQKIDVVQQLANTTVDLNQPNMSFSQNGPGFSNEQRSSQSQPMSAKKQAKVEELPELDSESEIFSYGYSSRKSVSSIDFTA
ncbi:flagellar hook-length control protein FliK [Pseudoneobacillus sp. C159]